MGAVNHLHAERLFTNLLSFQRIDSLGWICAHSSERNLFSFHSTLMDFHQPGLVGKIKYKGIHPGSSQFHRHIRATSTSSPNYCTVPRNGAPTQFQILVRRFVQIQPVFTIQTALQSCDPSASFDVNHAWVVPKGYPQVCSKNCEVMNNKVRGRSVNLYSIAKNFISPERSGQDLSVVY